MSFDEIITMMTQRIDSIGTMATQFGVSQDKFKQTIDDKFDLIRNLIKEIRENIGPAFNYYKTRDQQIKASLDQKTKLLEKCIAEQKEAAAQLVNLQERLETLVNTHRKAIQDLSSTNTAKETELKQLNDQHAAQLQKLTAEREQLVAENTRLTTERGKITNENLQLKAEHETISGKLAILQKKIEDQINLLKSKYHDVDNRNTNNFSKIEIIEQQLRDLLGSFDKLQLRPQAGVEAAASAAASDSSYRPLSAAAATSYRRPPLPPAAAASASAQVPPGAADKPPLPPPPLANKSRKPNIEIPENSITAFETPDKFFKTKSEIEEMKEKRRIVIDYMNELKQNQAKLNSYERELLNAYEEYTRSETLFKPKPYEKFAKLWNRNGSRGGNKRKTQKNKKIKSNNMRKISQKTNKNRNKSKGKSKRGGWVYKSNERLDSQSSEITSNSGSDSDSKSKTNSNVKGEGLRKTKKRHSHGHYKSKTKSRTHKMQ